MTQLRFLSKEHLPISRSRPSKVKDTGIIRLVQGGYGVWNPNEERLMTLPLGVQAQRNLTDRCIKALHDADLSPIVINAAGAPRGALEFAVRSLKRFNQLPAFYCEATSQGLELSGFCSDEEQAAQMLTDVVRTLGRVVTEQSVAVRRVDRVLDDGRAIDLLCAQDDALGGEPGFCSPDGALAVADSPCRAASFDGGEAPMTDVETPDCKTIEALCSFLSVPPEQTVKTMCYTLPDGKVVAVILRGDRHISLRKLRAALGGIEPHPTTPEELRNHLGDTAGYIGPAGLVETVSILADHSVEGCKNVVVGANKPGYHTIGATWGRDFSTQWIDDVTEIQVGDIISSEGGEAQPCQLRPVARFLTVDPVAAAEKSLTYNDANHKKQSIVSWKGLFDITALWTASAAADGLTATVLPCDVVLLGGDAPQARAALVSALTSKELRVLEDDRGVALDVALAETIFIGAPLRLVIQSKDEILWLAKGQPEETLSLQNAISRL